MGGQAIRLHNEHQANQLKVQGLATLNLSESDLVSMAKGSLEKRVLVWFVKSHTTVRNAWISAELHCGHPSNIGMYVKSIRESKDRKVKKLCRALLVKLNQP